MLYKRFKQIFFFSKNRFYSAWLIINDSTNILSVHLEKSFVEVFLQSFNSFLWILIRL